eukprot:g47186.t1
MFHPNGTFKAYQFYYTDHQCTRPGYTLVIKGRIRLLQDSWVTHGATNADYQLHQVTMTFHSEQAMAAILDKMNSSCSCSDCFGRAWSLQTTYEILNARSGWDCTAGLGFAMHELSLVRVEKQVHRQLIKKLFVGDIHTGWAQRTHHRPIGYQRPLQAALEQSNLNPEFSMDNQTPSEIKRPHSGQNTVFPFSLSCGQHHVHPCAACSIIYQADEHHPPILPAQQELGTHLGGQWASQVCEDRPAVLFLTRYLVFHTSSKTWEGHYTHYSDPACRRPTFLIRAWGRYSEGAPATQVRGGTNFAFTTRRVWVTPLDVTTALLLNSSTTGSCGQDGSWLPGLEQDLSHTNGCLALGIRLPHTEYELVRIEWDQASQRRLLLLGQRPTDGSSPDAPSKRATSYQTPLLQCSEEAVGISKRLKQHQQKETESQGTTAWEGSHLARLALLLVFTE